MEKTKIYNPLEVSLEEIRRDNHASIFNQDFEEYKKRITKGHKVFWDGDKWVLDNPQQQELESIPLEVIEKMLVNQVAQGNPSNIKIFQRNNTEKKDAGGFDWYSSLEGESFWMKKSWLKRDKLEGRKDSEGKLYYELSWEFIEEMAKRMANNKGEKYPLYNWKLPMGSEGIEGLKQAINRHHIEVMKGNYQDAEEPLGHILAYACNSMMLWEQLKR